MRLLLCCFLWFFLCSGPVFAVIENYEFSDESQRARYQQLTEELRCPKCQNQNLADSDSQIAADLRKELHAQLLAGKSDEAIVDFMRERYGDFVLYKPRVQRNTLLLWLGPLGLVALVAGLLLWSRRPPAVATAEPAVADACVSADSASQPPLLPARFMNWLSLLVLVAVAAGSLGLYRHFGALQALQITELGQQVFSGQLPEQQQLQKQALLLAELDGWLSSHPADEKFRYMRARLLAEGGAWDKAVSDYRELLARFPEQDNLLAEYAQVLFLQNNRVMTPDATAFLQQALQVNPHNVTALGLLGMHAFEQRDYSKAVDFWQRLLRIIPSGTQQADTINAGIARARELGRLPAVTAPADIRLQVQVTLGESLQAGPDETVFVLLRAVNGSRMPLAAVRTTVAALSQPVVLDTASSPMRGQVDLAAVDSFEVIARLSRSGQPMPAAGDWEGISEPLDRAAMPAQLALSVSKPVTP